jgi:hypothetical protein
MKYKKIFYNIPSAFFNNKMQGSITIGEKATKREIINKIVAKHFYGQPVIGWSIKDITYTCIIKEDKSI